MKSKLIFRILVNLGIMAVVALLIGWLTMMWLDHWTMHGDTITVPSVRGLGYTEAQARLAEAGLTPILSDSIYDNKTRPGTVLEQNPRPNTTVKPGREIYVTINAFSPKMVTVPALTDISVRQARSILEGLGIRDIVEREVPSEFPDLVLGARYRGQLLSAGARVPVNGSVTLEVGTPIEMNPDDADPEAANTSAEQLDLF